MLLCTVRGCRLPLAREKAQVVCPRGHSFDIAASGYINLLQPQDRRSKRPGDSAEIIAARRRLHDRGATAPLLEAIARMLALGGDDAVLDAGCGDGFYLGSLAARAGCSAHGVDISVPAISAAAKRFPQHEWIVANADRFVPYAGNSFSAALSITGRRNAAEFRRVLRSDGRLLVAVPAPNDLIELRSASGAPGRDRAARATSEFTGSFHLMEQSRATATADLDAAAVQDVLVSAYRPFRSKPVEAMRLTFSLDLLLFRPKPL